MKPSKTYTVLAAISREILADLLETSEEQLEEEEAADGEDLDLVVDGMRATLRAAVAAAHVEQSPQSSFDSGRSRVRRMLWVQAGVAIAAVALLAITVGGMVLHNENRAVTYATSTGESRTVVLRDGSTAILNSQTSLQWVGTNSERRIQFDAGEALFQVVPDRTRPFRVAIEGSEIRVLATQFDVYRKSNGTVVVTVLEGSVSVLDSSSEAPSWSRTLTQNEQIEYSDGKLLLDVHSIKATEVVAWREGLFDLRDATLSDAVEELNRYSVRPIILAPDARWKDLRLNGAMGIRNIDATLKSFERIVPGLQVLRTPDGPIVLSLQDQSQPSGATSHAEKRSPR